MAPYTIDLNLEGRKVVVVGLGPVGRRKVAGLLACGACVVAIDPIGCPEIASPLVQIIAEPYRDENLVGASLVFAAAWPEVNRQVVADAKARGVWVNAASDPECGDFALPAVWSDGPVRLTISTSGASPAMARMLRDRASLAIGPVAAKLAQVFAELRAEIFVAVIQPALRRRILGEWGDPHWLILAETQGIEAAKVALRARIDELQSIQARSALPSN